MIAYYISSLFLPVEWELKVIPTICKYVYSSKRLLGSTWSSVNRKRRKKQIIHRANQILNFKMANRVDNKKQLIDGLWLAATAGLKIRFTEDHYQLLRIFF